MRACSAMTETIPVRTDGITIQHVNLDQSEPARLVFTEPNLLEALGLDRGCGFEVINP
jgi:hypothetical protein